MSKYKKWLIHGLKLALDDNESSLLAQAAKVLSIPQEDIKGWQIVKKSLDARDKNNLFFNYTLELKVPWERRLRAKGRGLTTEQDSWQKPLRIEQGNDLLNNPPLIIGAGPAGLFAALLLAEKGYRPIVLEQGKCVEKRLEDVEAFWQNGQLNPHSNVQYGEGGAGAFSDGKLMSRGKDPLGHLVLQKLVEAGADPSILYWHKPHLGSDGLIKIVANIRKKIIDLGGQFLFESQVNDFFWQDQSLIGIAFNDNQRLSTQVAVLAPGNSGFDLYRLLAGQGLSLEVKPWAIGLRIEHPQDLIDDLQYGSSKGHPKLGAADYQLKYHMESNGRGVYSFCMCPGGSIVNAASRYGGLVTNGISYAARNSGKANSAIVVTVNSDDFGFDPLAALDWQESWERKAFLAGGGDYSLPVQKVEDFLANRLGEIDIKDFQPCSCGYRSADLRQCLPQPVIEGIEMALNQWQKKMPGFISPDAILVGVETRTSAPLRILRSENMQALDRKGLYPIGEGAGYAGGIISSAVDGCKAALAIIEKYAPLDKKVSL